MEGARKDHPTPLQRDGGLGSESAGPALIKDRGGERGLRRINHPPGHLPEAHLLKGDPGRTSVRRPPDVRHPGAGQDCDQVPDILQKVVNSAAQVGFRVRLDRDDTGRAFGHLIPDANKLPLVMSHAWFPDCGYLLLGGIGKICEKINDIQDASPMT